ncbi:MAG: hypothetical protein ACRD0O_00185, partial [Acidimicrobiia bacterium]
MNRRFRTASAVLAGLALTSGAACGSRLETEALQAANGAFQRASDTSAEPAATGAGPLSFQDATGAAGTTDPGETAAVASGSGPSGGAVSASGPVSAGSSTRTGASAAAGTPSAAAQNSA